MSQQSCDILNTPAPPPTAFVAALNPRWRQRAMIRSGLSLALAFLCFILYWQDGAVWQFVLVSIFVIFTVVPLMLVSACNPPLTVTQDHIILRALRKRVLPFDHIEGVLYEAENHLPGIKLSSGETVVIPWHLIDDPSGASEAMCNMLRCANDGQGVVDR